MDGERGSGGGGEGGWREKGAGQNVSGNNPDSHSSLSLQPGSPRETVCTGMIKYLLQCVSRFRLASIRGK